MNKVEIRGYYPGAIGHITEAHAVYYHENWGFDITFEVQVGKELSDFVGGFREDRDGLWIAGAGSRFAGSIAIDGSEGGNKGARLRWFIVLPEFQGKGLGCSLLQNAVEYCREREYNKIYLWTFKGLDAARSLYERSGFRLSFEHEVSQWGKRIIEQKFELNIGSHLKY